MVRLKLSDRQWRRVEHFLQRDATRGMRGRNDRMFFEAVLWWERTGVPWRDLPSEFGPWQTVFNRFNRWSKSGKWGRLLEELRADQDAEWHSIDSTINRAHQHSAGAKGGAAVHGIGRSRGGPSTKVHLIVDSLGLPIVFELTEGQRNDCVVAPGLIERVRPQCLLGDKAYDTNEIRRTLAAINAKPVLASNENRVLRMPLDKELYKARSEIECTFNLLKQFRRFATRYEKTLRNYSAVVAIACAFLWLRI